MGKKIKMVGFFDPVIATQLRNLTTGQMETAETLRGNVHIFNNTDQIVLFSESHTINTDGPMTSGWSDQGIYTTKTFDTTGFAQIPATVKIVILEMSVSCVWSATQPVGTLNNTYFLVFNPGAGLTFASGTCSISCFSQTGAPTDYFQNDRTILIPLVPGARTLTFNAHWPNLGVVLTNLFVFCSIVGYVA